MAKYVSATNSSCVLSLSHYKITQGLKKDQKYTMKISTVLNGKTISQISQEIEEFHEKLPVDEVAVEMAKKAQGTPSMPRYTPKTTKKGLDTEKGQDNKTIENTKDSVDGVPSKNTLLVQTYQNGDCSTERGT